jgi:hypothetical protein
MSARKRRTQKSSLQNQSPEAEPLSPGCPPQTSAVIWEKAPVIRE